MPRAARALAPRAEGTEGTEDGGRLGTRAHVIQQGRAARALAPRVDRIFRMGRLLRILATRSAGACAACPVYPCSRCRCPPFAPDRHARIVDTQDRAQIPGTRSPCGPEGHPGIHADRRRLPLSGAEGWRVDARGCNERRLSLAGRRKAFTTKAPRAPRTADSGGTANGQRLSPPRRQGRQGRRTASSVVGVLGVLGALVVDVVGRRCRILQRMLQESFGPKDFGVPSPSHATATAESSFPQV